MTLRRFDSIVVEGREVRLLNVVLLLKQLPVNTTKRETWSNHRTLYSDRHLYTHAHTFAIFGFESTINGDIERRRRL